MDGVLGREGAVLQLDVVVAVVVVVVAESGVIASVTGQESMGMVHWEN